MTDAENSSSRTPTEEGHPRPIASREGSGMNDLYHGTSDSAEGDGSDEANLATAPLALWQAIVYGDSVAAHLLSGTSSIIDGSVQALEAVTRIAPGDIDSMTAFLRPLVAANFISENEARLGRQSPKLSKILKIGQYADKLRSRSIIEYFNQVGLSGYTHLYQVAVLLDLAPNDPASTPVEYVASLLQNELARTRQDMLDLTRRLKRAKRDHEEAIGLGPPSRPNFDASHPDVGEAGSSGMTDQTARSFDLILAVLTADARRGLREDWYEPLPLCLRVGDDVADDAVFIAVSKLSDLPIIENCLLPGCGFGGSVSRTFLVHAPNGPEVTDATLVVVAQRDSQERAHIAEIGWLPPSEVIDPFTLACLLVPDARSKLNLFASKKTDGWRSVIGEENWRLADE